MKELKLWYSIINSLNNNKKVALMVVAESSNSSPGKQGFKIAVNEDGVLFGTIGGGIMEKDLIDEAIEKLKSNSKTFIKRLHHSPADINESSGLICGGKQTFIFNFLDEFDLNIINKIISVLENQTKSLIRISNEGIELEFNPNQTYKSFFSYSSENKFEYKEIYGTIDTIYIIGGGHIGLALSKVMANLDFYIVIVDHRKDVFTMNENIFAEKKIVSDYNEIGSFIKEGDNSFIVIVSPQHIGDEDALYSVINKNVKYIGMMGSEKKIKTVFNNLAAKGIEKELLDKVHSPIGLKIGAQTPDEIAISIAAELIKVKYKN